MKNSICLSCGHSFQEHKEHYSPSTHCTAIEGVFNWGFAYCTCDRFKHYPWYVRLSALPALLRKVH